MESPIRPLRACCFLDFLGEELQDGRKERSGMWSQELLEWTLIRFPGRFTIFCLVIIKSYRAPLAIGYFVSGAVWNPLVQVARAESPCLAHPSSPHRSGRSVVPKGEAATRFHEQRYVEKCLPLGRQIIIET